MPLLMQSEIIPLDSGMGNVGRIALEAGSITAKVASLETLWSFFIDVVNDPDAATNRDPLFLEKAMRHPWVAACMGMRQEKVASMQTRVDAPEDPVNPDLAKAASRYIGRIWAALQRKDELFAQMQLGVLHGGIGHEWNWIRLPDGTQRPVEFTSIKKDRFKFDRTGQMCLLTRRQPVWGGYLGVTPTNPERPSRLPPGKFTYHRYQVIPGSWFQPEDEGYQYFGYGLDQPLYDVVMRDLACWYLQMEWLRQYGNPPRGLYVPTPSAQWQDDIRNIAKRFKTDSLVPIPSNVEEGQRIFEIIDAEVPNPSFNAFGEARKRHYDDIEAIILGSVGTLSQQDKGGYASHKSRQQSGPDLLAQRDAARICSTLNAQLVPAMLKFGPEQFRELDPADLPQIAIYDEQDVSGDVVDALEKASKLVPIGKRTMYRRLRIDEPEDGEETVEPPQEQSPYEHLDELNGGKDPAETGDEPSKAIGEDDE